MEDNNQRIIELIKKSTDGDKQAWQKLCALYNLSLYTAAIAITHNSKKAEKAVQRAFDYAFDHFEELNNLNDFENWMKRLVVKEAEKQGTDTEEYNVSETEYHPEEEKAYETPEIDLDAEERQNIVTEALDCLNDMEQTVMLMYGYDHKNIDEISTELNLKEEDTEKILGSAEKKVSAYIEKSGSNRKYEIAGLPFFLLLLTNLHPKAAVQPVIPAIHIADAADIGFKETIVDSASKVNAAAKKPQINIFQKAIQTFANTGASHAAGTAAMSTTAKVITAVSVAAVAAGGGVIGIVHHNRIQQEQQTEVSTETQKADISEITYDPASETELPESASASEETAPAVSSTPLPSEINQKYDVSYLNVMLDPSILLETHKGEYSQYGGIETSDDTLVDLGDVYAAENQALYQVEEYPDSRAFSYADCTVEQLSDGQYGCAVPGEYIQTKVGAVWEGTIYISKDAYISIPGISVTQDGEKAYIAFSDYLEYGAMMVQLPANNPKMLTADIDSIDENGYINMMTLVLYDWQTN